MDALREVTNVGCGHAATALSRLVGGRRVQIELPRSWVRPASELEQVLVSDGERAAVASFLMQGELSGRLLLVFAEAQALRLSAALLGVPSADALDDARRSAFAEAANIIASACLSAMGGLLGQRLVPSTPTLVQGDASTVRRKVLPWVPQDRPTLMVEASFVAHLSPLLPGQLIVLPDAAGLKALLRQLGM